MEIMSIPFTYMQVRLVMVFFMLFDSFAFLDLLIKVHYLIILAEFFLSSFNQIFFFLFSSVSEFLQSFLNDFFILWCSHKAKLFFSLFQNLWLIY
jgi:hypothetical protein